MIRQFDESLGRLLDQLRDWGLEQNTVLIFLTDNGTAAGSYNAGMRGRKGSQDHGGHRVPCFLRWTADQLGPPRDIKQLTAHIDLLPTLIELCGLEKPPSLPLDGTSLVPLLRRGADWAERTLLVHSQRVEQPRKWKTCAVMTDRWRLVDGRELYDIRADPGQQLDLAAQYPNAVLDLRAAYEKWWNDISGRFGEFVPIVIGTSAENPTRLTCHDWHAPDESVPWDQRMIARAPEANGFWAVDIARAGRYRITLRQQPPQAKFPIAAAQARVSIGDVRAECPVPPGATDVALEMTLAAGQARVQTWLIEKEGKSRGSFFVDVERLGE